MKNFIDNQIELSVRYQAKLRSLKHCHQLLKVNPTSSELLSMKAQLHLEAFEIIQELIREYLPGNESNVVSNNVVTMSEKFFENN